MVKNPICCNKGRFFTFLTPVLSVVPKSFRCFHYSPPRSQTEISIYRNLHIVTKDVHDTVEGHY